jgi:hypothetical protein
MKHLKPKDMKCILLNVAIFILAITSLLAQPVIQWDRTLGGANTEYMRDVIQTADGGYLLVGGSESPAGADRADALRGSADGWIVKLNATGVKEWDKALGGTGFDYFSKVVQTSDGGYFLAGRSYPGGGGDKPETDETGELWVVKLSPSKTIEWQRQIDVEGYANKSIQDMQMLSDGSYILAVNGQDAGGSENLDKAFLIKLSPKADVEWIKTYIGLDPGIPRRINCINLTSDGGYVIGLEIGGFEEHPNLYHMIKFGSQGLIEWEKTLGLLEDGQASKVRSVKQTTDGGYIVGGISAAKAFAEKSESSLDYDFWIVKLDSSGEDILWDKTIFGNNY